MCDYNNHFIKMTKKRYSIFEIILDPSMKGKISGYKVRGLWFEIKKATKRFEFLKKIDLKKNHLRLLLEDPDHFQFKNIWNVIDIYDPENLFDSMFSWLAKTNPDPSVSGVWGLINKMKNEAII